MFLTFAIFLLSISISFFITLLTTQIDSTRLFTVFVVITVLGAIVGFVLLTLWWWFSASRSKIFKDIRDRMRPDAIPGEPLVIDAESPEAI